mmetsp:Transcript_6779/g.19611  ORF Transcript_6779/g.19611 Transcript_6779/m.19611 type:complete len:283 (-) Transcript_6779:140-988(-)
MHGALQGDAVPGVVRLAPEDEVVLGVVHELLRDGVVSPTPVNRGRALRVDLLLHRFAQRRPKQLLREVRAGAHGDAAVHQIRLLRGDAQREPAADAGAHQQHLLRRARVLGDLDGVRDPARQRRVIEGPAGAANAIVVGDDEGLLPAHAAHRLKGGAPPAILRAVQRRQVCAGLGTSQNACIVSRGLGLGLGKGLTKHRRPELSNCLRLDVISGRRGKHAVHGQVHAVAARERDAPLRQRPALRWLILRDLAQRPTPRARARAPRRGPQAPPEVQRHGRDHA